MAHSKREPLTVSENYLRSSNIMQLITWSAISSFDFNWKQFDIKGFTIFTIFVNEYLTFC